MKILLTGAAGQLGRELTPLLAERGTLVTTDRAVLEGHDHRAVDLGDRSALLALLKSVRPDIIVNTAADTAVDAAESHRVRAWRLNRDVPAWIAAWAADTGARVVHYSTDYVFDGRATEPYPEETEPAPVSVYGASKAAGEEALAESGADHLLLRTAWVYAAHGQNFMRRMIELGRERDRLSVVNDQVGCPTWARNLAQATVQVLDRLPSGDDAPRILHYSDADAVTWFDFARRIFERAEARGLLDRAPELTAIGSDEYPTAAVRPRYSVLDTRRIQSAFGVRPASLDASLDACLEELQRSE